MTEQPMSLSMALASGLMLAPEGACEDVENADVCQSNVRPVIKRGHQIYDYYSDSNYVSNVEADDLSEAPVRILSHDGSDPSGESMFRPLAGLNVLYRNFADAANAKIPRHDDTEADMETVLLKIKEALLAASTEYIGNAFGSFESSHLGATDAERVKNAASMFSPNARHEEQAVYMNVLERGASVAEAVDVTARSRVYYALRYLDSDQLFADDRFFFLDRLRIVTVVVFACKLLILGYMDTNSDRREMAQTEFYNLLSWVYERDIRPYVRSDHDSMGGLDDMFYRNVSQGQAIRRRSKELVKERERAEAVQNNLKSIENADRLVRRRQRRSRWMLWGTVGVGVVTVLTLIFLYAYRQYLYMYIIAVVVGGSILLLEVFRGVDLLLDV